MKYLAKFNDTDDPGFEFAEWYGYRDGVDSVVESLMGLGWDHLAGLVGELTLEGEL